MTPPDLPIRWNCTLVGDRGSRGAFWVVHRIGHYHEEICRVQHLPPETMERYAREIASLPDLISGARVLLAAIDEGEPVEALIASERRSQKLSILGKLRAAIQRFDGTEVA